MMSPDAFSSNWFSIKGKYPRQWGSLIKERQTKTTTEETLNIKNLLSWRNPIPLQNCYVWRKTDNMHTDASSEERESELTVRTCSKERPMVNNVLGNCGWGSRIKSRGPFTSGVFCSLACSWTWFFCLLC